MRTHIQPKTVASPSRKLLCAVLSTEAGMHAQGHFQIILNRQHCPLLQRDLSPFMRIMYASGVWSYIVGAISTPFFIIVPMVTCAAVALLET